MKKIKINSYSDLERLRGKEEEFIINLENCSLNERKRVIDFLSGLAFNGSIVKLNNNEFEIKY